MSPRRLAGASSFSMLTGGVYAFRLRRFRYLFAFRWWGKGCGRLSTAGPWPALTFLQHSTQYVASGHVSMATRLAINTPSPATENRLFRHRGGFEAMAQQASENVRRDHSSPCGRAHDPLLYDRKRHRDQRQHHGQGYLRSHFRKHYPHGGRVCRSAPLAPRARFRSSGRSLFPPVQVAGAPGAPVAIAIGRRAVNGGQPPTQESYDAAATPWWQRQCGVAVRGLCANVRDSGGFA